MMNLKKSLTFFFTSAVLVLSAAVDEVSSYYTLSLHNAKPGTPVKLTIRLFDEKVQPVEAKNISLKISNPAVRVVQAPVSTGTAGVYTASVVADSKAAADIVVIADGVTVRENIAFNHSFEIGSRNRPTGIANYANRYDSTYWLWDDSNAFRGKRSVRVINFDKTKSVYLGIAGFQNKNILLNHNYIFEVYVRYDNVSGERGVSIVLSQNDAKGSNIRRRHRYSGFRAGSSNGKWVKIRTEAYNPVPEAVSLGASVVNLAAGGELNIDSARVYLTPSAAWGDFPEASAVANNKARYLFPRINFALAIRKEFNAAKELLAKTIRSYGDKPQLIVDFKATVAGWEKQMATRMSGEAAYLLQKEMQLKTTAFQKSSAALAADSLDALLGE